MKLAGTINIVERIRRQNSLKKLEKVSGKTPQFTKEKHQAFTYRLGQSGPKIQNGNYTSRQTNCGSWSGDDQTDHK